MRLCPNFAFIFLSVLITLVVGCSDQAMDTRSADKNSKNSGLTSSNEKGIDDSQDVSGAYLLRCGPSAVTSGLEGKYSDEVSYYGCNLINAATGEVFAGGVEINALHVNTEMGLYRVDDADLLRDHARAGGWHFVFAVPSRFGRVKQISAEYSVVIEQEKVAAVSADQRVDAKPALPAVKEEPNLSLEPLPADTPTFIPSPMTHSDGWFYEEEDEEEVETELVPEHIPF